MFTNTKPTTECLGSVVIQSKAAASTQGYPGYIPVPDSAVGSTSVLVQVYFNPGELPAGKTASDYRDVPLVSIDEFNDSVPASGYATTGMKLLNWGNFLIETPKNIGRAKIVPLDENLNVYVVFNFYK